MFSAGTERGRDMKQVKTNTANKQGSEFTNQLFSVIGVLANIDLFKVNNGKTRKNVKYVQSKQ